MHLIISTLVKAFFCYCPPTNRDDFICNMTHLQKNKANMKKNLVLQYLFYTDSNQKSIKVCIYMFMCL